MLSYNKEVIKALYNANATRTLTLIVLDIKQGSNISKSEKNVILEDIQKLKMSNKWMYEKEEQLLTEYQENIKKKKSINMLTSRDKDLYNLKRLEKLKEYDFTL